MKNTILMSLLFLFSTVGLSQDKNNYKEKREEIQAQKIAFISNELSLTPDEAKVFWPVYNEYEAKIKETHKQQREYMKKMNDFETLSEEDAYKFSQEIIKLDIKQAEIKQEYLIKFSEIIGKKRAAKVFYAEEKFKRELLKCLRDK